VAALDGLRFIAALCVLIAHGYEYVIVQGSTDTPGLLARVIESLAVPGMTLFFVLSGFVIHLNYSRTAARGWTGTFDFFIARFSRLYPLFLLVFAFDFWRLLSAEGFLSGKPKLDFDLFGPLPFYLSFTQTWLPIPHDGHLVFVHYGSLTGAAQATGAMWSLSLEFLFYATYPWIANLISRLRGATLAICAILISLIAITYYAWCSSHMSIILDLGRRLFGSPSVASEFGAWVTFYSPFGRMTEFLLGAFAAQQYLSGSKESGIFARWPTVSTAAAATTFVGIFVVTVLSGSPIGTFIGLCTASVVALLMLLAVQYTTSVSRSLSGALVVSLGEASYSLYLLHWYTMTQWAAPYAYPLSFSGRIAVYLAGMTITIAISRFVFVFFERPSMKWLRRNFKPLRLGLTLGVAFVLITGLSVAASMQTHAVRRLCASIQSMDCSALGIVRVPANAR
jgi:peptidoglycan/LPS O-acetylase OafA/YrhL